MTIEEFYEEYPEFNHIGSPTSIFEEVITAYFESRTCGVCKYRARGICINDESMLCQAWVVKSFGCNKWEGKDDNN